MAQGCWRLPCSCLPGWESTRRSSMGSMGSIPRKRSSTRMPCPCQVSVPGTLTNESAYHALYQCCGSASPRCGSGFDLTPCCRSGCWSRFLFDADLDPTFHLMRIRIQILPSFQIKAQTLEKVLIFHTVHFVLSSEKWCGSGSVHFDADPDPDFYLMRIWIFVLIRMRIQVTWCGSGSTTLPYSQFA